MSVIKGSDCVHHLLPGSGWLLTTPQGKKTNVPPVLFLHIPLSAVMMFVFGSCAAKLNTLFSNYRHTLLANNIIHNLVIMIIIIHHYV